MSDRPRVQRIDQADGRVQAARQAERRLFDHYALDYEAHTVNVEAYGMRIRVLVAGSGPPLILVPGGNGEAIEFVPMMACLNGHRIIAVNRPGGGMSDAIDHRSVDFRRLGLASLTAVLDAFDLDSAPFAANSLGGLWTFWLAQAHPERVEAMVQFGCPAFLFGTAAPLPMRLLSVPVLNRLLFRAFRAGSAEDIRKIFGMLGSSDETRATLPESYVEIFYRMFDLPTYQLAWLSLMETVLRPWGSKRRYVLDADDLREIEHRTLFVWGDNDVFGSADVGRRAEAAMPNAELRVIAGGHVPYIDSPEECARLVSAFLHGLDVPSLLPEPRSRKVG